MTNGKEIVLSNEKRMAQKTANQTVRKLMSSGWIAYSHIKSRNVMAFKGTKNNYKAATFFFWSGGSVTVILTKYERKV